MKIIDIPTPQAIVETLSINLPSDDTLKAEILHNLLRLCTSAYDLPLFDGGSIAVNSQAYLILLAFLEENKIDKNKLLKSTERISTKQMGSFLDNLWQATKILLYELKENEGTYISQNTQIEKNMLMRTMLVELVTHQDPEVRGTVALTMGNLPGHYVEELIELANDSHPEVRDCALFVMKNNPGLFHDALEHFAQEQELNGNDSD